uniref:Polyamine oxidaselike [Tribolium castaneum] n=1 Tax=Lepeophtheirus salmonis TaxID=72036 RepID=A0A0K2VIB8_LEPSM
MKDKCQVIIIGAGMAGSSAAVHLYENGITDILLLEARDRVGGRMHSIPYKGKILDLGAQWITGVSPNNSVYNLATKLGIVKGDPRESEDETANDQKYYPLSSRGTPISTKAHKIAKSIFEKFIYNIDNYYLRKDRNGGSIKDFFDQSVPSCVEEIVDENLPTLKKEVYNILNGMLNVLRSYVGGEPDECSVDLFGTSIELPGGEMPVEGGVGQIVQSLVSFLPKDVVYLDSPVTKIDWSNPQNISVNIHDHEIKCNYVISTIPLGVLKSTHTTLFHPSLGEEKTLSIQRFNAGAVCKLFVEWDQPWWTPNFGGFLLSRGEEDYIGDWTDYVGDFNGVKNYSTLLLTWVVGKYSSIIDGIDEEEIIDGLMKLIWKYTGDPSIERASRIIRHKWTLDPYTLGGYSFPGLNSNPEDMNILASSLPSEEEPSLLFAGDAACPDYWSYMHGARTSGLIAAEKIVGISKN